MDIVRRHTTSNDICSFLLVALMEDNPCERPHLTPTNDLSRVFRMREIAHIFRTRICKYVCNSLFGLATLAHCPTE